jgi:hypothetical protein
MWFPVLGVLALLIPPIKGMAKLARTGEDQPPIRRVYVNMPGLPRTTLLKAATDVIRGRVVATRAVFPEGGVGYTDVNIQLNWSLIGADDSQLTVRFPGADDGVNVTTVVGGPQVFLDNDVIVLIDRDDEAGITSLLGVNYGFYRVLKDDAGSERVYGERAVGVPMDEFVSDLSNDWEASREGN